MVDWDIDQFPLMVEAAKTPGQIAAEKWLAEHGEEMRPVEPGMLDRLTQEHEPDPRDRNFGVPTGGGGISGGSGLHYSPEGYNRPNRSYPGDSVEPEHAPVHDYDDNGTGEYSDPFDDDYDRDDEEPQEYHIVTRPRDAIHGLNVFDEHSYHAFGHAYTGTEESAMDMFAEDHPEYDTERYPDTATHEIVSAHSPAYHDTWHEDLAAEDRTFNNRIAPRGLRRESPEVPGHRAYRYEEPNGVVHRLWYNPWSSSGSSWQTSRYDPRLERDQQLPWTQHHHSTSQDPLGDALDQIEHNKRFAG